MHPERAARLFATLGLWLVIASLALRGFGLLQSSQTMRSLSAHPEGADLYPILTGFSVSPDDKAVLYTRQGQVSENPQVFRMSLEDGTISPVTGQSNQLAPFMIREGRVFFPVVDNDNPTPASPAGTKVLEYIRSPDEQSLAFSAERTGGMVGLYILHASSQLDWLGEAPFIADLDWSPNNRDLLYVASTEKVKQIFRYTQSNQQVQQLTTGVWDTAHPRWSRDGKSIAYFQTHPSQLPHNAKDVPFDLYAVSANGDDPKRLIENAPMKDLAWVRLGDATSGGFLAYSLPLPDHPQTRYFYLLNPSDASTRRLFPPVEMVAFDCPSHIAVAKPVNVKISLQNSLPSTVQVGIRIQASPKPPAVLPTDKQAPLIVAVTPYQSSQLPTPVEIELPAAPGVFRFVSARLQMGDAYPFAEQHCVIQNTDGWLPSLPFLNVTIVLLITGILVCLPWLLQHRQKRWVMLWISAPLAWVLFVSLEMARLGIQLFRL